MRKGMRTTRRAVVGTPMYTIEKGLDKTMTAKEARETIAAMRRGVEEVPSYVEVQAIKAWLSKK